MIMYRAILSFAAAALAAVVAFAVPAYAAKPGGGNAASSKAVFSLNTDGMMFLPFAATTGCGETGFDDPSDLLCTPWYMLYNLTDAIKTSSVGGLEAALSMECSLWTDSEATAMIGTTGSGGSRAGIEVRVYVGAEAMYPGQVVYCDRMQYISLTIPELFVDVGTSLNPIVLPIFSNDPFVVGLFERTKNVHAYHFYLPAPSTDLHDIRVEVRGIVQCFKDGAPAGCQDSGIDIPKLIGEPNGDRIEGGTKAVIGKSTLIVQEQQNWRILDDGVYP